MHAPTKNANDSDAQVTSQVAMLLEGFEGYGIGTIVKLYATALPELTFVALSEGQLVDWLRANGNRVEIVPGLAEFHEGGPSIGVLMRSPAMLRQASRDARRIDALLRERGIRVVHAHWRPQQVIAGFLRKRGYLSVWQINNTMNPTRLMGAGKKLNHWLAKWGCDLLLPASDAIGENWAGCGVQSITVRNAAIPIYDQPNTLPETPIRCIVAGRLEHLKGHHLAVEAVIRARKAGHDVHLDIYGGPLENNAYADDLRQRIAAAGSSDVIRLQGFKTDIRERHQQYHLGMQCRIDIEPCSLWVCETLVDGLPLLASASGGTPELVEDGVTGFLYRPGDVDDLSQKLLRLVAVPAELRAMRAATFERGQKHFTIDRFARETVTAYRQLIGERKHAATIPSRQAY